MEVDSVAYKNMSLKELIDRDKKKSKGGRDGKFRSKAGKSGKGTTKSVRGAANTDRQGGRPRFETKNQKGGDGKANIFKAKRTTNMIQKRKDHPNKTNPEIRQQRTMRPASGRSHKSVGGQNKPRFSDVERVAQRRGPVQPARGSGPRPRSGRVPISERGGLARPRKPVVAPKKQKTLRVGTKPEPKKMQMRLSNVRLKVRNLDEKQVTNEDLKKLFAKIGDLIMCRFDRNNFGQFLGSATVTYKNPEHAKKAIGEYHNAYLDDKVLTVEYDIDTDQRAKEGPAMAGETFVKQSGPQIRKSNSGGNTKTFRLNNNK